MCGDYHGGDGLKMIEIVENLLKVAPAIYIGKESFKVVPKLAAQVEKGKKLGDAWNKIEERLGQENVPAAKLELERLKTALVRFRDQELESANRLLSSDPSAALPKLTSLAKLLKKTTLAQPIHDRIAVLKSSTELKTGIRMAKALANAKKSVAKIKPCKTCKRKGLKSHQAGCPSCRSANEKSILKQVSRLKKVLESNEKNPMAETVRAFISAHE